MRTMLLVVVALITTSVVWGQEPAEFEQDPPPAQKILEGEGAPSREVAKLETRAYNALLGTRNGAEKHNSSQTGTVVKVTGCGNSVVLQQWRMADAKAERIRHQHGSGSRMYRQARARANKLALRLAGVRRDLRAESEARRSADVKLGGRIDAEAISRACGDEALSGQIVAEADQRQAGDQKLQGQVATEVKERVEANMQLAVGLLVSILLLGGAAAYASARR